MVYILGTKQIKTENSYSKNAQDSITKQLLNTNLAVETWKKHYQPQR